MIETHPEYHLQTWDAGWAQIKEVLKRHYKVELQSFRKRVSELGGMLREIFTEKYEIYRK